MITIIWFTCAVLSFNHSYDVKVDDTQRMRFVPLSIIRQTSFLVKRFFQSWKQMVFEFFQKFGSDKR